MSRIDDLIAELCPDGIEFKALGDVGELIRGRRFTKDDVVPMGLRSIHYGEIYTCYATSTTTTVSQVRADLASQLRFARSGDVVIAAVGETVEDVGKAVAWLGEGDVAVHDDCFIFRHPLDPTFVSYWFQTSMLNAQKTKYVARAKVKRLSGEDLGKLRIPVPPLSVQREIVKTLDAFTGLEADLRGELQAELQARRGQYEHYRDQLLTSIETERVRWMTLGELGSWFGGGTPSKSVPAFWTDGSIPWLSPKDMVVDTVLTTQDHITHEAIAGSAVKLVPAGSVAFVVRSNILRRHLPIALVPSAVTLNQDMRALVPASGVLPRYVFQVCRARSDSILAATGRTDGSMAAIDSSKLLNYRVPVPSIDAQHRIVGMLEEFDALINELSVGLPAEVTARRKQYEYYRDRLLTFEETSA